MITDGCEANGRADVISLNLLGQKDYFKKYRQDPDLSLLENMLIFEH